MPTAVVEVERRNTKFGIVTKILWREIGMDRTNLAEMIGLQPNSAKMVSTQHASCSSFA
jgi:hypothetical protein